MPLSYKKLINLFALARLMKSYIFFNPLKQKGSKKLAVQNGGKYTNTFSIISKIMLKNIFRYVLIYLCIGG